VVLTGSPNWSTRAARSEEIWLRLLDRPGTTARYLRHARDLFRSPYASRRVLTPTQLQRSLAHARGTGQPVPSWLELD
jgi:hypothetical protein